MTVVSQETPSRQDLVGGPGELSKHLLGRLTVLRFPQDLSGSQADRVGPQDDTGVPLTLYGPGLQLSKIKKSRTQVWEQREIWFRHTGHHRRHIVTGLLEEFFAIARPARENEVWHVAIVVLRRSNGKPGAMSELSVR